MTSGADPEFLQGGPSLCYIIGGEPTARGTIDLKSESIRVFVNQSMITYLGNKRSERIKGGLIVLMANLVCSLCLVLTVNDKHHVVHVIGRLLWIIEFLLCIVYL